MISFFKKIYAGFGWIVVLILVLFFSVVKKWSKEMYAEHKFGSAYNAERKKTGLPLVKNYTKCLFIGNGVKYEFAGAHSLKGIEYSYFMNVEEEYDYFNLKYGDINMVYYPETRRWDITYDPLSTGPSRKLTYKEFADTLSANGVYVLN